MNEHSAVQSALGDLGSCLSHIGALVGQANARFGFACVQESPMAQSTSNGPLPPPPVESPLTAIIRSMVVQANQTADRLLDLINRSQLPSPSDVTPQARAAEDARSAHLQQCGSQRFGR